MEPTLRADLARTWALVPIRGLESAKTRLGGDLDAEERRDLVVDLLRRTLRATRDARRIAGTIVVTMDPDAAGIARDHRAIGLVERAPGLNGAITAARSVAVARGATAVLILPADLPAIDAAAVDAVVDAGARVAPRSADAAHAKARATPLPGDPVAQPGGEALRPKGVVVLVGDRHGSGTNALLVSPPDLIEPAFGPASRDLHGAAALASGAAFVELAGPLALDVDTAEDLVDAEATLGTIRG
ncbi:MAG TPA: 2-phospho-L-lactate guanylyltransferase [Candidatus Limnocylindria bacterium]|nr:2-phospho-L-lactate guanylyltransferase [Candidatus Limnocylindria bacterium]